MKRTCVIFNPAAKGERARRFRYQLDRIGAECALKPTTGPGGGRPLGAEAVREGFETIVAAGGDGTLNEVLNGIGDVAGGYEQARLGVLPLGTVNVFAKELAIPAGLGRAWEVIRQGRERRIDLPVVELAPERQAQATGHADPNPPPGTRRFFAQMAGAGFDAQAVEWVGVQLKKRIGYFAYVVAVLRTLQSPLPEIRVWNGAHQLTGEMVLFGNGRFYGGAHVVFPEAKVDDGKLEVVVFPRVNWGVAFQCLGRFLCRRVPPHSGTQCFRAETIRLTSAGRAPVEVDGESIGHLPATFSVQRQALRVIVP